MRTRCLNPNVHDYPRYGGRGIAICNEWLGSFAAFLADMGPRPEGTSLDRVDVNGNYEPGNCRWATRTEQGRNTRYNRIITAFGQSKTITEWAEELGIRRATLQARLVRYGYDPERALTSRRYEDRSRYPIGYPADEF